MPDDHAQAQERTEAEIEADARLVGWQDEAEFPGDKAKWKPAADYLAMAEAQLPMARAQNRKLTETNQELLRRLKAQETAMSGLQESMEALKEFHSADTKRKVAEARNKLLGELKAARAAGDVDAEMEIVDALTQAGTNGTESAKKPVAPTTTPQGPTPEWLAWREANPKFESDRKWRGVCVGMAEDMRADPKWNDLRGRAFYDEVTRQTDKWFAERAVTRRVDKSEAGGSAGDSGGGGGVRGKSYAQLPPDAKAQCEKDSKRHVGKGFKTLADWQAYYAKVYWENE